MGKLSSFIRDKTRNGYYLGSLETAGYQKVVDGSGTAEILALEGSPVSYSLDGVNVAGNLTSTSPVSYTNGLWIKKAQLEADSSTPWDDTTVYVDRTFSAPTSSASYLAMAGPDLLSTNGNDKVYVHDGISSTVKQTLDVGAVGEIFGVGYDGTNLVLMVQGSDSYFQIKTFDGISSTLVSTDYYNAFRYGIPSGIAFSGVDLMSIDSGEDKFSISTGKDTKNLKVSYNLPWTERTTWKTADVTWDGNNVVLHSWDAGKVFVMEGKTSTVKSVVSTLNATFDLGVTSTGNELITVSGGTISVWKRKGPIPAAPSYFALNLRS